MALNIKTAYRALLMLNSNTNLLKNLDVEAVNRSEFPLAFVQPVTNNEILIHTMPQRPGK